MKQRMTLEEAEALKAEWQLQKGNTISFVPRKQAEAIDCTINGVVIDKRVNMVLVRIKAGDKQYHKTPNELADSKITVVEKAAPVVKEPKAKKAENTDAE